MRVAIFGAGSLGTVLGAYLSKAGINVDLINRNKSHVSALRENGAHITGTVDFTEKVNALLPEEMTGKYDIVYLLTKVLDNRTVIEGIKPFLEDGGIICTMQNGLPELTVSEVIGAERTYGCAIGWGATMKEGGVCELTSDPSALHFNIGSYSGKTCGRFDAMVKMLGTMGIVKIENNLAGARWSKLLINSAFSGLGTALGCTFGGVAANKKSRLYAQRIIKECIDVAKAQNIKIEPVQGKDIAALFDYNSWIKQKISLMIIPVAMKKHRNIKPSMLQDLEKGKPCEIDAINGAVSECGDRYGIDTPYNDKVTEIIKGIEAGEYKPSMDNITLFGSISGKK